MSALAITITGKEQAALLPVETPGSLGPDEVKGRTLVSLVSPGTELSWNYLGKGGQFPSTPGYAAVFEAEEIGSNVSGIKPGVRLFCMGNHQSIQQHAVSNVVPVSDGLAPQEAVLARLMGVTMTTLMTTKARPGDVVLITGAGPVGYLCAHLFTISGYDVRIVDPDPNRRKIAEESGIKNVSSLVPEDDMVKGKVALVIDCSGHEQAVLDGVRVVRKGGEVVLVGVPWKRCTDLTAHELLDVVFHNYCVLRSGWEWELPRHASDFCPHSIYSGFRLALRWLAEHRIPAQGLIALHRPENAQEVYQGLLHVKTEGLFQVFDWQDRSDNK
jgi:threonine dehydrogenase-like Zn-dependent dehydrogenase